MTTEERLYNRIEELEKEYIATGEHIKNLKYNINNSNYFYERYKEALKEDQESYAYACNLIDAYNWIGYRKYGCPSKIYIMKRNEFSKVRIFYISDEGYLKELVGWTVAKIEQIEGPMGDGYYERIKDSKELIELADNYKDRIGYAINKMKEYERNIEDLNAALENKEAEYPKIFEEGSKTLKELEEKYPEYYKTKYRN